MLRRKAVKMPDLESLAYGALKKLGTSRVGELAKVIFDNQFYQSGGTYSMPPEFYSLFEQYLSPGPLDRLSDDEFYAVAELAFDHLAGKLEDALTIASTRVAERRWYDVGKADPPVATIDIYRNCYDSEGEPTTKEEGLPAVCRYKAYFSEMYGKPYDGSFGVRAYAEGNSSTEVVRALVDQWSRAGFLE
ncbi:MAG: hypothetical protein ACXABY_11075 [Candidatus Thorarchaeota archaeon]|jgi:hypothetical protein